MSKEAATLGYDWQDLNPSRDRASPPILGAVLEPQGACYWMLERSYTSEEMFDYAEAQYRSDFPYLFEQLEYSAVVRAHTPAIFKDIEGTMRAYYRGAVMAIGTLEASLPRSAFRDLTPDQHNRFEELDGIDLEHWLLYVQAASVNQTRPLIEAVESRYFLLPGEPEYIKTALLIGARYAYIFLAHMRACFERENEIAWMVRDEDSLQGWLAYRNGDYS